MSFFFQVNGYSAHTSPIMSGGEALPALLSCRNDLLLLLCPPPRGYFRSITCCHGNNFTKVLLENASYEFYLYGIILAENFPRVCLVTFWQNIQM
ncbi:hypothetical protein CDAR_438901 [Caerostris darwini]|uniref:Uncharacterized protein n=1 Tax=Caerostris darwini TaxID=1538125 RepID=A0AAV4X4V5_9ARAC|nr:hypothetical protein CDAR_438901 [Caerostris darwini]